MAMDQSLLEFWNSQDTTSDAEAADLLRAEITRQEARVAAGNPYVRAEVEYLTRALKRLERGARD